LDRNEQLARVLREAWTDLSHRNNIAAIDAGSNALRLVIARAESSLKYQELKTERYPLRLGYHVFTKHKLEGQVIKKAVKAFQHFRVLMGQYNVEQYRAVATSAVREAQNGKNLLERIHDATGIRVEVIDGADEARLVRCAVAAALGDKLSPRLIVDLGGGSLEISLLNGQIVENTVALAIGTVRIMENFGIRAAISRGDVETIRSYILSLLRRASPQWPPLRGALAVACGGNAEALALLAPGRPQGGFETLDNRTLRRKLRQIISLDVPQRMKAFSVRKDRAEVMGIAGIVFSTLARCWHLDRFLIPGVGVREGLLREQLRSLFDAEPAFADEAQRHAVLSAARGYAARLNYEAGHSEKVRELAVSLFDQLRPRHRMEPGMRLVLELAAVLHDIGNIVRRNQHYKHGEYLIRHGNIAGLESRWRDMVACIVRYHSEPEPDEDSKLFASFQPAEQRHIRALIALLRVADGMDWDHRQSVTKVEAKMHGKAACFSLGMKRRSRLILWACQQRAKLFEDVFGLRAEFRAAP
jgi:exopolyphosphatase/guanosine-5'-triphosphate,3'-diphosphate pyrophosphatase